MRGAAEPALGCSLLVETATEEASPDRGERSTGRKPRSPRAPRSSMHEAAVTLVTCPPSTSSSSPTTVATSFGRCVERACRPRRRRTSSSLTTPPPTRPLRSWKTSPVSAIALEQNGGFAHGCNVGWQHGSAPYVLFLNPDARIESEGLDRLWPRSREAPRRRGRRTVDSPH